jgi:hypothetical protein
MRHRFHSICPYFAMFPESFAETWIERLAPPNSVVLDPFCGRGTAPFQALLMGRRAVGVDINPVAYCIAHAKTNAPMLSVVRRRLSTLKRGYNAADWRKPASKMPEFFRLCFHRNTLPTLLYLRASLQWETSDVDCMLAAIVLGSLHGEADKSSSYLSNQMPRVISTKPAYSVRWWNQRGLLPPKRDVFALLCDRLAFRYESEPPQRRATVLRMDMRRLPMCKQIPGTIRTVITSPPYLDVTNFEEDQWLRLWFLGGAPAPTYQQFSRDDRTESAVRYWELISDMWRVLGRILSPGAHIVLRLGANGLAPDQIVEAVTGTTSLARRPVRLLGTEESPIVRRQTGAFRPDSRGCRVEVDCHFQIK